ncbi:hypothetical protein [Mucilaginibacter sp.]|uniref:hypothetical protein n=1 Tax=Mucilaginibacter sp. TaxID=1882438 RepID=UPI002604458F|nr:hypothetical protein [Mucilaginibacter sp.]
MSSKVALGIALTLASTIGLIYATVAEMEGYVPHSLLFGVMFISVFGLFAGVVMLHNELEGI